MKLRALPLLSLLALWFAGAGCASLDLAAEGDPNRVLEGTIVVPTPLVAGAEVHIRLVEQPNREAPLPATHDAGLAARNRLPRVERVVAESTQTLAAATNGPVPFRIEYQASDVLLRRGLTIDVRIAQNGQVTHRTISARLVTLASSPYKHEVPVEPVK